MNAISVYGLVVVLINFVISYNLNPENVIFTSIRRGFRLHMFRQQKDFIERDNNLEILRKRNKLQPLVSPFTLFPCTLNGTRSPSVPSSVHRLRPGDIDVIGALGDSLSAGVGLSAKNIREVYFENRGIAPTSGGMGDWREFLTIPNILKEFNPNLIGYAKMPALLIQKQSQFNVANTAATSVDVPYMASILIKRMKSDRRVDMKNHWKMVSLMIGPNDFCLNFCYQNSSELILQNHRRDLIKTLRLLRDNVPRLFVNLILAPNLKILIEFINRPLKCYINNLFVCPCLIGERFKRYRENYIGLMRKWQDVEMEVANLDEFNTNDFTVVVQPFSRDFVFPKTANGVTDYTLLSEDCFHFSQKGNAMMANSIWNNMLERVGEKSKRETILFQKFKCPSEDAPFLFTRSNSERCYNYYR